MVGFFLTYALEPESRTLVSIGLSLVAAVVGGATSFCAFAQADSSGQ